MAKFLHRRAWLTAVAATLLLAMPSYAFLTPLKGGRKRSDARAIQALEDQWHDALMHGDAAAMAPILADDFLGVSSNGTLTDKAQYLKRVSAGRYLFKKIEVEESKTRLHEDSAIVVSLAQIEATLEGIELSGRYRYTRVYRRVPTGSWKLINFEATRVSGMAPGAGDLRDGVPIKQQPH
jgi:ketosteroid isomerase-like protein